MTSQVTLSTVITSELVQCDICRDLIQSDANTRRLFCGHTYHYDCIRSWYQQLMITKTQSNRQDLFPFMCPLCRKNGGPLKPDEGEKPKYLVHLCDRPLPVGKNLCHATKRNGERCQNLAKKGQYCGVHSHLGKEGEIH